MRVLLQSLQHGIEDLGPRTWASGMSKRQLQGFSVPFYAEPFSTQLMDKGDEALLKIKLTRCRDGHILSATVNHILADAGRALRLVERLGELYRSAAEGTPKGAPLRASSSLETPEGFAAALEGPPPQWQPEAPDHGLTARQWAAAPYRMYRHVTDPFDMHLLYLPAVVTRRLKALAAKSGAGGEGGEGRVSTMDAAQGFIATLVADLRGKDLVPTAPQELTVNLDLLHRGQRFRDPGALARHVGNAVHILHVPGVAPGTEVPGNTGGAGGSDEVKQRLVQAVGMNARLIRRSVAEFRSDPAHTLRALERQARMVQEREMRVAAAFVVKGADLKVASTTAVTAFPFDTVSCPTCQLPFRLKNRATLRRGASWRAPDALPPIVWVACRLVTGEAWCWCRLTSGWAPPITPRSTTSPASTGGASCRRRRGTAAAAVACCAVSRWPQGCRPGW